MKLEVLVYADWDYLVELERKAIQKFNTRAPNGYNLTDGGDGAPGYKHSDEAREAFRQRAIGRKHSAESNFKKGSGWRGKKRPEHAAKLTNRKRPEHAQFMRDLWARRKQKETNHA